MVLAAGLSATSASAASPVPVEGQSISRATDISPRPEAVLTVHGVRRIPGGTAVYLSAGFPPGTQNATKANLAAVGSGGQYGKYAAGDIIWLKENGLASAGVLDAAGRTFYTTLVTPDQKCVCTHGSLINHVEDGAGTAYAFYYVVPELPAGVTAVTVVAGDRMFPDVPVGNGAMTPALDATKPIRVGTGWPQIDHAALSSVTDIKASILPLTQQVTDASGDITNRTDPGSKSIDVASDVLFAKDSATLTPAASATLQKAATALQKAGAKGAVKVIGYTDSDASDSYNLALSKRRADAVAAAIKPMLPSGITLTTEGRGEADPVASNATDEGKALNRRVALTFAQGSGQ